MFQTTVGNNIGFGVPGTLYLEGPLRAQPGVLASASAANNVVGRAFTLADGGTASFTAPVDPTPMDMVAGGTGVFAGILANPKVYANYGTALDGPLASNLAMPNGAVAEFVLETAGLIVTLPAAFNVGDFVYYNTTTGVLSSAAPNAAAPAGTERVPGGRVAYFKSDVAGLAVITFNSNVDPVEA